MPDFIAIGDIHGLDDALAALLAKLPADGLLVFLGDYLDRGPDVRGVIDRLLALEQERSCVFIRGNHEDMALKALEGSTADHNLWLANGGDATLRSYDGGPILPAHREFLHRTRYYFETEQYIFVHAGLWPGETPETSDPEDLCWVREPFLSSDYHWGKLVIHGHTPTATRLPDIHLNRINIDTGAVYGGQLTALLLPEMAFTAVDTPARRFP